LETQQHSTTPTNLISLIEAGCLLVHGLLQDVEPEASSEVKGRLLYDAKEELLDICALVKAERTNGLLRLIRPMVEKVVTCSYLQANPQEFSAFIEREAYDKLKYCRLLIRYFPQVLTIEQRKEVDTFISVEGPKHGPGPKCELCKAKKEPHHSWSKATPEQMYEAAGLGLLYPLYYAMATNEIHATHFSQKFSVPFDWYFHQVYILSILTVMVSLARSVCRDKMKLAEEECMFLIASSPPLQSALNGG
jgi:hypothetical protein